MLKINKLNKIGIFALPVFALVQSCSYTDSNNSVRDNTIEFKKKTTDGIDIHFSYNKSQKLQVHFNAEDQIMYFDNENLPLEIRKIQNLDTLSKYLDSSYIFFKKASDNKQVLKLNLKLLGGGKYDNDENIKTYLEARKKYYKSLSTYALNSELNILKKTKEGLSAATSEISEKLDAVNNNILYLMTKHFAKVKGLEGLQQKEIDKSINTYKAAEYEFTECLANMDKSLFIITKEIDIVCDLIKY